jgi:hypothetical protein
LHHGIFNLEDCRLVASAVPSPMFFFLAEGGDRRLVARLEHVCGPGLADPLTEYLADSRGRFSRSHLLSACGIQLASWKGIPVQSNFHLQTMHPVRPCTLRHRPRPITTWRTDHPDRTNYCSPIRLHDDIRHHSCIHESRLTMAAPFCNTGRFRPI